MDSFVELATCDVCQGRYTKPRQLPCGHTFCTQCIENLVKHSAVGGRVKCPMCREEHAVPSNGVEGFRVDFNLQKLVEAVGKTPQSGATSNPIHVPPTTVPPENPQHRIRDKMQRLRTALNSVNQQRLSEAKQEWLEGQANLTEVMSHADEYFDEVESVLQNLFETLQQEKRRTLAKMEPVLVDCQQTVAILDDVQDLLLQDDPLDEVQILVDTGYEHLAEDKVDAYNQWLNKLGILMNGAKPPKYRFDSNGDTGTLIGFDAGGKFTELE